MQNQPAPINWGVWLRWLAFLLPIAIGAGVTGYLLGVSSQENTPDTPPAIALDDVNPIDGGEGAGLSEASFAPELENAPPPLNFDLEWDSADTNRSNTAAWGDVENDGDLDLVVGGNGRAPLTLHRFDRGRFAATQLLVDGVTQVFVSQEGQVSAAGDGDIEDWPANSDDVRAVAWGDADNDGDLDLAVARSGNTSRTAIWLNDGDGQFTAVLLLGEPDSAENNTRALTWGDYDGDGDLDLAAANLGANVIYTNQTAQQETDQPLTFTPQPFGDNVSTFDIEWAQLNSNSELDLLVRTYTQENKPVIKLYLDVADQRAGALAAQTVQPSNGAGFLWDIAVSNINANDRQEISGLYRRGSQMEVQLYELDDQNIPQPVQVDLILPLTTTQTMTGTQAITIAPTTVDLINVGRAYELDWIDINRDGRPDLVTDASTIWLNGQNGTAEFYYPATNPIVLNNGERLRQFAWADIEGDSDLDLAIISRVARPTLVYLNRTEGNWRVDSTLFDSGAGYALAWADYNDDGRFDVAIGTAAGPAIYSNQGDRFVRDAQWSPASVTEPVSPTTALAWGDANGDTLIDLAVFGADGQAAVWLHPLSGDGATRIALPDIPPDVAITGAHWVDMDRNGSLELFIHGTQFAQLVRLADDGTVESILPAAVADAWRGMTIDAAAWGDADGDGDADLALAVAGEPLRWYENRTGTLQATPVWQSAETDATSVAWGDLNGDGALDLIAGAPDGVLKAYQSDLAQHDAQLLPSNASWLSIDDIRACGIAVGDVDGDGDLDLAAFGRSILAIYTNRKGRLEPTATTRVGYSTVAEDECRPATSDISLTDIDSDGDIDVGLALGDQNRLLRNDRQIVLSQADAGQTTSVVVDPKGSQANESGVRAANTERSLAPAQGVATTAVLDQRVIPIRYRIDSPAGQRFDVQGFYSIDGGGNWFKAVPAADSHVTNLSVGEHQFEWDVVSSGFVGQSDNVVFRIESLPVKTTATGAATGPFETPFVSAQTFPFRVRGLQIEVVDENNRPLEGAIVYRVPAGRQTGGSLLVGANNEPYRTDSSGRVEGFSRLTTGDSLVALRPVPPDEISIPFTDAYTLYQMSTAPTEAGLALEPLVLTDTRRSVVLPISTDNPLLLFDLDVSLEWDGRNDQGFMRDLEGAFEEASRVLFDVTNGQVALGTVDIYHDRERWDSADILILADNSLRPSATIGGVVAQPMTRTVGTLSSITYRPGKVQMGPIWDAFGESTADLGDQWDRTLAHELAHYFLFLFDDYLGIDDSGDLSTIDCPVSFMTYAFDPSYNEFLAQENLTTDALARDPQLEQCLATLGKVQTGLDSWRLIQQFYPFLNARGGAAFDGPNNLPLNVTQIVVHEPEDPATTLPSRTMDVRERGGSAIYRPSAQGYLIQQQGTPELLTDDRIMALGNPLGGGDRLRVRGAENGDRFCLFDYSGDTAYSGCETLTDASGNVQLAPVPDGLAWAPEIGVVYLPDRAEFFLAMSHAQETSSNNLMVQLYPTYRTSMGEAYHAPTATLQPVADLAGYYTATLPAIANVFDIRIWEEGREGVHEIVTQFSFVGYLGEDGTPLVEPEPQGVLIRNQGTPDLTDDTVVALGNPLLGENMLRTGDAEAGDRLCFYDYVGSIARSGCEPVPTGGEQMPVDSFAENQVWTPEIWVTRPEGSEDVFVQLSTALTGTQPASLSIQLYPSDVSAENQPYSAPVALLNGPISGTDTYTTTLPTSSEAFYLRVWQEGAGDDGLELVTWFSLADYSALSGNPIARLPGGPISHLPGGPISHLPGGPISHLPGGPISHLPGGPISHLPGGPISHLPGGPISHLPGGPISHLPGGPISHLPGGPISHLPGGPISHLPGGPISHLPGGITADGQVTVYDTDDIFGGGGVEALQTLTRLPQSVEAPIPEWLTLVGPLFNIDINASATVSGTRRLSYHYLQRDVPKGFEHEKILKMYFLPDGATRWQRIEETDLDVDSNTAIVDVQGSGIYALLATVALPQLEPGWNLVTYPLLEDRSAENGFDSIEFVSIFNAERDANGSWITPVGEPECNAFLEPVNTLRFGEVYWIYLEEDATPFLDVPSD